MILATDSDWVKDWVKDWDSLQEKVIPPDSDSLQATEKDSDLPLDWDWVTMEYHHW